MALLRTAVIDRVNCKLFEQSFCIGLNHDEVSIETFIFNVYLELIRWVLPHAMIYIIFLKALKGLPVMNESHLYPYRSSGNKLSPLMGCMLLGIFHGLNILISKFS